MATGFGARCIGRLGGGDVSVNTYYVPSTDSTALYEGDFVKVVDTTGAMDSNAEYITVTRAATGDPILGVIKGFKPDPSLPYTGKIRAASTARYVHVIDDPKAIYEIQEDAVGGAVTAALVGSLSNADIIVAAGSSVTGLSGTMLDSNTAAASAEDLKIIGVRRDGSNVAAQSGGAILHVMILNANHALVKTDSQA
ncbi:MAG TPA: hypothetical protein VGK47_07455 [Nitrososphaeraceae archaeon]